jgi:glycosyltransferase involved in cell wall biosynthesis
MLKKICVMLSTYNGEKYVAEQIDSILNQAGVEVIVLIRDDGSTDNTKKILRQYELEHKNVKIFLEENVGVVKSFFLLVQRSFQIQSDFYSFADQDDYWLPEKLLVAVQELQLEVVSNELPILYCSSLTITDASLNVIRQAKIPQYICFENAVIQNIVTGCTTVFNEKMRNYFFQGIEKSNNIIMHDWWLYLLATSIGQIVFDNRSFIFYRQHQNNVIGYKTGMFKFFHIFKSSLFYKTDTLKRQLICFQEIYKAELSLDKNHLILDFINADKFTKRLNFCFIKHRFRIKRQSWKDMILYYFRYILIDL